jgi:hypothetical protein
MRPGYDSRPIRAANVDAVRAMNAFKRFSFLEVSFMIFGGLAHVPANQDPAAAFYGNAAVAPAAQAITDRAKTAPQP